MKLNNDSSSMSVVQSSWDILSPHGRKKFPLILIALAVMTLAESATVAIIFPLVNALTSNNFSVYQRVADHIFLDIEDMRFFAIIGSTSLVLFALILRSCVTFWQNKFIEHERASVSVSLTKEYAHMEFLRMINVKKTIVERNILAEVDVLFGQFFRPGLTIFSNLLLSLFIFGILLSLSPLLTLVSLLLFVIYILILYILVKKKLMRLGQARLDQNAKRFSYLSQITRGIKDLKIKRIEDVFVGLFSQASHAQASATANTQSLTVIPNYALESFILISVISYFALATNSQSLNEGQLSLEIAVTFAVALIRIIPSFKGIFQAIARIRNNATVLKTISEALADYSGNSKNNEVCFDKNEASNIPIEESVKIQRIEIESLTFSYPDSNKVLCDFEDEYTAGTWYAIIGPSGSGKSTLVDIISGLLEPQTGQCIFEFDDGSSRFPHEFAQFGAYTPQQALIFPGDFYENIALGVPPAEINESRVKEVAEICQLGELIRQLPNSYRSIIGDGGIALSGGQAQRIGIARSLYRQPKLIIFDESTSALDEITEKKILFGIREYLNHSIVLMIAHKKSVIDFCDHSVDIE